MKMHYHLPRRARSALLSLGAKKKRQQLGDQIVRSIAINVIEPGRALNVAIASLLWRPNTLDVVEVKVNIQLFLF